MSETKLSILHLSYQFSISIAVPLTPITFDCSIVNKNLSVNLLHHRETFQFPQTARQTDSGTVRQWNSGTVEQTRCIFKHLLPNGKFICHFSCPFVVAFNLLSKRSLVFHFLNAFFSFCYPNKHKESCLTMWRDLFDIEVIRRCVQCPVAQILI